MKLTIPILITEAQSLEEIQDQNAVASASLIISHCGSGGYRILKSRECGGYNPQEVYQIGVIEFLFGRTLNMTFNQ